MELVKLKHAYCTPLDVFLSVLRDYERPQRQPDGFAQLQMDTKLRFPP
jgi:hypothetical protein